MRKIIISLLMVSLMIVPAFAQQSVRTASMNLGADDIEDVGNIISFPQLLPLYSGTVWYNNVDNYNEQTILITEVAGNVGGIGLFQNVGATLNPSPLAVDYVGYNNHATNVEYYYPDAILNVGYAMDLAGGTFGALVLVNMYSEVDDHATTTDFTADPDNVNEAAFNDGGASYYGVIVGYGMEEVGPFASLNTSLGIGLIGFSDEWTNPRSTAAVAADADALAPMDTLEKDGGMDIKVLAQGIMEMDDATSLRLSAGLNRTSLGVIVTESSDLDGDGSYTTATVNDTNNIWEDSGSLMVIGLRAVLNKDVNDGGLLVVGTGVEILSSSDEHTATEWNNVQTPAAYAQETVDEYENSSSTLQIPVVIAVEDELRENIVLRVGAAKNILVKDSSESSNNNNYQMVAGAYGPGDDTASEMSRLDSDGLNTSLGVGAIFGNFTINADISKEILFDGPYWLTGADDNGSGFASAIDILYKF